METEKIKTIDEFLIEYMHHKPKVYNDGITERCYPVSAIIEMTEKYTSQFKQPPVSSPTSKENEFTAFDKIRSETPKEVDDMVDKAMKEADERETAIEFGEFLEEARDYYENQTIEELFDLFKQRNE